VTTALDYASLPTMKLAGSASAIVFLFAVAACERSNQAPGPVSNPTRSLRPQPELALAFAASTETIFEATTGEELAKMSVQQQAALSVVPAGLKITATGIDPSLLLPPFITGKRAILRVVIVSPVSTPIQLFYPLREQPAHNEEHSQMLMLKPGANVVYFDLDQPNLIDPLRLDPAAAPGDYVIKSIVARAPTTPSPR
jgi:hypothetical protein